jgi:Ca-activated chloride channel family protein
MTSSINRLKVMRSVNTPLAAAIAAVAKDLATASGRRLAVIVSDGAESCGGNPSKAIKRLRAAGISVNFVGLGLDKRTRKAMAKLAVLGGGQYFDARDPDQLATAVTTATNAPFEVIDAGGRVVSTGTADAGAIPVPPGSYTVIVHAATNLTFRSVVIVTGELTTLVAGTGP